MTHTDHEFTGEIRRTKQRLWADDKRHNYVGVDGRISVPALLTHLSETIPDVPLDEVFLNWTTLVWIDDATPEELAQQAARKAKEAAKLEEWERETLDRLSAKYAAPAGRATEREASGA